MKRDEIEIDFLTVAKEEYSAAVGCNSKNDGEGASVILQFVLSAAAISIAESLQKLTERPTVNDKLLEACKAGLSFLTGATLEGVGFGVKRRMASIIEDAEKAKVS